MQLHFTLKNNYLILINNVVIREVRVISELILHFFIIYDLNYIFYFKFKK